MKMSVSEHLQDVLLFLSGCHMIDSFCFRFSCRDRKSCPISSLRKMGTQRHLDCEMTCLCASPFSHS